MTSRLWIVAYDIAAPDRLRRVAEILESTGTRVQKSVFECFLETDQLGCLQTCLREVIDADADRVRYYPLCPWCLDRLVWQGRGIAPVRADYYVV